MSKNPYWEGDGITLYHGRCEDILPTLPADSIDALLTDPPYFQVKDEDWDNQWDKAAEFLEWLGEVLRECERLLHYSASAWVFASSVLCGQVADVVARHFNVLNTIRWVKPSSVHNKMDITTLRRFMSPWEAIVFAESKLYREDDLRHTYFSAFGDYFRSEREQAGKTRRYVSARLPGYKNQDSANANIFNWELGKNLISRRDYEAFRTALGPGYLTRSYDSLRSLFGELKCQYEEVRRPFTLSTSGPASDVWNFPAVQAYPGKHPCEKPAPMLRHMVETGSRPGEMILDCFAGSGSTLLVARDTGRRAIGIEMDERWCEHAARKLDQYAMDFGDAS